MFIWEQQQQQHDLSSLPASVVSGGIILNGEKWPEKERVVSSWAEGKKNLASHDLTHPEREGRGGILADWSWLLYVGNLAQSSQLSWHCWIYKYIYIWEYLYYSMQSWALIFLLFYIYMDTYKYFNFLYMIKKINFCMFCKVNLTEGGLFLYAWPRDKLFLQWGWSGSIFFSEQQTPTAQLCVYMYISICIYLYVISNFHKPKTIILSLHVATDLCLRREPWKEAQLVAGTELLKLQKQKIHGRSESDLNTHVLCHMGGQWTLQHWTLCLRCLVQFDSVNAH